MISYSKELVRRRELLITICAAQRQGLSGEVQTLLAKLSIFDIGLTLLARLKKNPAWITGLVVGLAVIRPRRLLPVLQTSLLVWQTLGVLAPALKDMLGKRLQGTASALSSPARIAGYSSQASLLTNEAGQYKSRICGTLL